MSKEENEIGADAAEDVVRAREAEKLRIIGRGLDIGENLLRDIFVAGAAAAEPRKEE